MYLDLFLDPDWRLRGAKTGRHTDLSIKKKLGQLVGGGGWKKNGHAWPLRRDTSHKSDPCTRVNRANYLKIGRQKDTQASMEKIHIINLPCMLTQAYRPPNKGRLANKSRIANKSLTARGGMMIWQWVMETCLTLGLSL